MKVYVKRSQNDDSLPGDPTTANSGGLKSLTNTEWLQQDLYLKAGLPEGPEPSAISKGMHGIRKPDPEFDASLRIVLGRIAGYLDWIDFELAARLNFRFALPAM